MNLEEEIRNGYTVSHKMKKVWAVQLQLLSKLLQVCKDNDLKIWADSGTLLGAIRHKGYIPWDDDIDMAMFREDYDKLVRISQKEFTAPFFFQTAYSENAPFPRGHAQLRMDGTTAILPFDIFQDFHQGIFIDIFPFDAVPANPSERDTLIRTSRQLLNGLSFYTYGSFSFFHPRYDLAYFKNRKSIDSAGFKNRFAAFEDLFRQYSISDNNTISYLSFTPDLSLSMEKSWYEQELLLPFEDMYIPVPGGYDKILTKLYGDYMTPVQAPTMHGGFAALDPDRSYVDYIPNLRKTRKKELWKERFQRAVERLK